MRLLGSVIVFVDLQTNANGLDDCVRLVPARFADFLGRLILKLPVVHELGDGRLRVRRDLDEVESRLLSQAQRVFYADDADLLASRADKANPVHMDALINSWFVVDGYSFISSTCTRTENCPKERVWARSDPIPYDREIRRHQVGVSPLAFRLVPVGRLKL